MAKDDERNNVITIDTNSEKSTDEQFEEQKDVLESLVKSALGIEDSADTENAGENRPKVLTRNCRVSLTPDEILVRSNLMMKTFDEIDEEETKFAVLKEDHKSAVKSLDGKIQRLRNAISTGIEWRDVECHEVFNYEKWEVSVIRTDTGEVVEDRPMTTAERQQTLPLDK